MSNRHSHSDLLAAAIARVRAKHNLPNAEDSETYLQCPLCSGTAPESEFDEVQEPDTDEESDSDGDDERDDEVEDSYRTDPITTSAQNDDDSNQRDADKVPKWENARRIDRFNYLTQSLVAASTNKNH